MSIPSPKKSADILDVGSLDFSVTLGFSSSKDMFALPLATEGGRNANEVDEEVSPSNVGSSTPEMLSSSSTDNAVVAAAGLKLLNTSPGPSPPPKTRSGAEGTGAFCFGAGNIDNRDEKPAPVPAFAFFAGGLSIITSSSLSSACFKVGKLIAMVFFFFIGPFVKDGGGREIELFSDWIGGRHWDVPSPSLSLPLP